MSGDEKSTDAEIDAMLGGDPVERAEQYLEQGAEVEAAATCRFALEAKEEPDRERLGEVFRRAGNLPQGWEKALEEFAEEPSIEAWDELVEPLPEEAMYTRMRHAIQVLGRLGVSPDMLFRLATRHGSLPDAFELVDSGEVEPSTVLEVAEQKPEGVRGMWYAVVARAHAGRGDIFGAVRLLKRALRETDEPALVDMHAYQIWIEADEKEREQVRAVWEPSSEFSVDV